MLFGVRSSRIERSMAKSVKEGEKELSCGLSVIARSFLAYSNLGVCDFVEGDELKILYR